MQAGVGWDVTVSSQRLLMPEGVGESIKVDKSLLSAYSPGMRRIRNAFMKTSTYRSLGDKDIYILFLTTLPMQGEDDGSEFDGYMPYGKQFGFISSTNLSIEKLAWAAAHELGHGAFSLQHVWLEPGYSRETANLMGYTTSSELFRWQWEQIHHPQYRSNYQAEVEDLGAANIQFVKIEEKKANEGMYITPSGLPIFLENIKGVYVLNAAEAGIQKVNWTQEAILGFTTNDGVKYWADIRGNSFYGYYNTQNLAQYTYYTSYKTKEMVEDKEYIVNRYKEPSFEQVQISSRLWIQYLGNWGGYKGEGHLVMNADCNCNELYQQRKREGYPLVVEKSPIQTAIANDNCLLKLPTVDINPTSFIEESEFIKGFNSFYKAGMIGIFGPLVSFHTSAIATETVVEGSIAAYQPCIDAAGYLAKQLMSNAVKRFYFGFLTSSTSQFGVNVLTLDDPSIENAFREIDWNDAFISGITFSILGGLKQTTTLLNTTNQIAIREGSTLFIVNFSVAAVDWKPFSLEDKYSDIFTDKEFSAFVVELIISSIGLKDFQMQQRISDYIYDKKPKWGWEKKFEKLLSSEEFTLTMDKNKELIFLLWQSYTKECFKISIKEDTPVNLNVVGKIDLDKMVDEFKKNQIKISTQNPKDNTVKTSLIRKVEPIWN